nr:15494_t:CDS:2 [Entrophospora candida]
MNYSDSISFIRIPTWCKNIHEFHISLFGFTGPEVCKNAGSKTFIFSIYASLVTIDKGVQGNIVGDSRATGSANDDGIPELVGNSEAASEKKEIAKANYVITTTTTTTDDDDDRAQPKITAAPPHGCNQSLIDMANSEGKIVKRNCSRCKEAKKYVKSLNSKVSRIEDLVNSLAKSVQDTLINDNKDQDHNMQTNQQTLPEILLNGQNINTINAINNNIGGDSGSNNVKNRVKTMPFNRIAINKRNLWNYSIEDLIKLVYNINNYVTSQNNDNDDEYNNRDNNRVRNRIM